MPDAPRSLVLIEDEPLAREELHRLLAAHPQWRVVGETGSVPEARTLLAGGGYDVVLLDIQLAGGSGFDLVPHVAPGARIIFVTAHDQFALRAFDVNALDYLLKPVSATRLAAALQRAAVPSPTAPSAPATTTVANASAAPFPPPLVPGDRVYLKGERHGRFVALADLAAIIADDNYTEVFVADGERFLLRRSLRAWESCLPATQFVRVHRQAIVNLAQIERIEAPDSETPQLHVRGLRAPLTCSHRLSPELRRRLG